MSHAMQQNTQQTQAEAETGPAIPSRAKVWCHLGILMAVAIAVYITHSILRFNGYHAKGFDLGIFDQAVRQYSLFKPPIVPIKGDGFHLLGDHFHPILALLSPFYWIWDDPRMLGIIMALALASTAIPVYFFTRRRSHHHVCALVVSTALLAFWPFQAMVNWDFHEVTLGVPVIAWVMWALDARRFWLACGLSLILLTVREDMGITLVAIAVVMLFYRAWWQALVTAVSGMIGFVVVLQVVIPYFSPSGEFSYWEYTALGEDLGSSLAFMLTNPLETIGILFDHPLKIGLWLLHFVPLLLLPLLSPITLAAAPLLLSRLFNDRLNVWAPVYQYDAMPSVILILAAVDGAYRLTQWIRTWRDSSQTSGTDHLPKDATEATTGQPRPRPASVVGTVVLGVSLVGTVTFPAVFPFHQLLTASYWIPSEKAQAFDRAVSMIPDDVCVEAADHAAPHLSTRTAVGLHGTLNDDRSTWMIIDDEVEELGGNHPLTPQEAFDRAERLGFEVVWEDQGVWVLHRDQPVDPACSQYLHR